MPARFSLSRSVTYLLLGAASFVFLTPFAWLVSTSLKPIEQAMSLPPTWLPRAYYTKVLGQRREVTLDFAVKERGAVAVAADGKIVFVDAQHLATAPPELRLLHPVEPGWWHVSERRESSAESGTAPWDIVPYSAVDATVRFRWENYSRALARLGGDSAENGTVDQTAHVSAWVFLGNSLTVAILGAIGTVLSNAIVAYGFARVRWRGRDTFFALTLATLMVPFPVLMVPLYGVFKALHMVGTLMPLWLPAWFGSAFNIFLMRQFFRTIPEDLSEAARIDGCSEWRIFWRIILPLSKPVLAVAALFHFLFAWNDFLGPVLYLTRKPTFTLALALQSYQSQVGGVQWHYLMAASVVTILPAVVLFLLMQKTFIQGIATTGTKG